MCIYLFSCSCLVAAIVIRTPRSPLENNFLLIHRARLSLCLSLSLSDPPSLSIYLSISLSLLPAHAPCESLSLKPSFSAALCNSGSAVGFAPHLYLILAENTKCCPHSWCVKHGGLFAPLSHRPFLFFSRPLALALLRLHERDSPRQLEADPDLAVSGESFNRWEKAAQGNRPAIHDVHGANHLSRAEHRQTACQL